jgi:hypothetical protein
VLLMWLQCVLLLLLQCMLLLLQCMLLLLQCVLLHQSLLSSQPMSFLYAFFSCSVSRSGIQFPEELRRTYFFDWGDGE